MTRRAAWSGFAAFLVALAFLTGRYTAPTRVEERELRQDQAVSATVSKVAVRAAERQDRHIATRIVYREVIRPDGTLERERTVDRRADASSVSSAEQQADSSRVVSLDSKVERSRTTEVRRPDWRAGALVGTNVLAVRPSLSPPYITPLELGVHVERRIVGPLWLGAYGFSYGAVGVSASIEF